MSAFNLSSLSVICLFTVCSSDSSVFFDFSCELKSNFSFSIDMWSFCSFKYLLFKVLNSLDASIFVLSTFNSDLSCNFCISNFNVLHFDLYKFATSPCPKYFILMFANDLSTESNCRA
eukprot:NODE_148_length_17471_cov_0.413136.p15 type:complete len:118 gc:universal NODE_148_length_17471_cov_0.413136:1261-1614(+)